MAELLREYLATATRRRIVMIVTLVLGLLSIWPAVDDYTAKSAAHAKLSADLAKVQKTVAGLQAARELEQAKSKELAQLEAMCVDEDDMNAFRARVVKLARDKGCKVRSVNPGMAKSVSWKPGDDPLDIPPGAASQPKTPFQLVTQELAVSLSADMKSAKEFVKELNKLDVHSKADCDFIRRQGLKVEEMELKDLVDKLNDFGLMVHTRQLNMSSTTGVDKEIVLDLALVLFNLKRTPPPQG
jgi:hypothetical protein